MWELKKKQKKEREMTKTYAYLEGEYITFLYNLFRTLSHVSSAGYSGQVLILMNIFFWIVLKLAK